MGEVFTFVDASHLISKANLLEERDEGRKKKYDKLNNETLPKVAHDSEARIGCKGGNKFWYGYKKTRSVVDIQSGLINKVSVTPPNVTDAQGFEQVAPEQGAYITRIKDIVQTLRARPQPKRAFIWRRSRGTI